MRFSEVFLRLGLSLVAWMAAFAYVLWLTLVARTSCGHDGDELHRLLLGFVPVIIALSFSFQLTRALGDVHQIMRWFSLPFVILLPLSLWRIWPVFERTNLQSLSICGDIAAPAWQVIWPFAQLLALAALTYAMIRVWQRPSS